MTGLTTLVWIVGLATTLWLVKTAITTQSTQVIRETDAGERLTMNANFTIFTSKKKVAAKLEEIFETTDARKKFVFDRFQKLIEDEERKQAETKTSLKSV